MSDTPNPQGGAPADSGSADDAPTDEVKSSEAPAVDDPAGAPEADAKADEKADEGDETGKSIESLEDALKALSEARKDAAKYRTKYRDLESNVADAKSVDEVKALVAEAVKNETAEKHALLIENVALAHGLPPELAARLRGDTRAELEADAESLKQFVNPAPPSTDPRLEGGLDGGSAEDTGFDFNDMVKQARRPRF